MDDALHATLDGWVNFYLITGGAAAALTGLQFVVQTLLASEPVRPIGADDPEGGIAAFSSPTIVHLSLALVISALVCVPWPGYQSMRAALALLGAGGLGYVGIVLRRARAQQSYAPVFEDWLWHFLLPGAAYGGLMLAAFFFHRGVDGPLFVVGAATLLLLCVALHNAWDTVTWFTVSLIRKEAAAAPAAHREQQAEIATSPSTDE
jgi:hypothetical protein